MTNDEGMRRAIAIGRVGIALGQSPFGAVISLGDIVYSEAHNTVKQHQDPTAHAEINAIRAACAALQTTDLSGSTLYATCEPCPMCLAAIHWAKIDRVVFGATIQEAEIRGIPQVHLTAPELALRMASPMKLESRVLHDECAALFVEWKRQIPANPA